jgi:hypothetical protein
MIHVEVEDYKKDVIREHVDGNPFVELVCGVRLSNC